MLALVQQRATKLDVGSIEVVFGRVEQGSQRPGNERVFLVEPREAHPGAKASQRGMALGHHDLSVDQTEGPQRVLDPTPTTLLRAP